MPMLIQKMLRYIRRMPRTIIIILIALCAIICSCISINIAIQHAEEKQTTLVSTTQQDSSAVTLKKSQVYESRKNNFEELKRNASVRGVNWLIANNEIIPSNRNGFALIYKITADDELASNLLKIIEKRKANRLQMDVKINTQDPKYLNWNNGLRLVVMELIRKKCNGQESSEGVDQVRKIISKHQNGIFNNQTVSAGSLFVASHLLNKIGISIEKIYNRTIADLKIQQNYSIPNIYALTHIFLTKSDYLSIYLDPKEYEWEVNALNAILEKYADEKRLNDVEIDMISEVIISMKLLKLPETANSEIVYKKLINQQNDDGSWGGNGIDIGAKTHHTVVSTIALSKFPDRLKKEDIFCF